MATILLADDDKTVRDLVRRALEGEGHAVRVTDDGAEAKEAFDEAGSAFDLVVTDVEMPGLDGVSLAKHALAASPTVKVLLMSGFTEALDKGRWLEAARLGFVSKPFTLEQIRASVRAVLG